MGLDARKYGLPVRQLHQRQHIERRRQIQYRHKAQGQCLRQGDHDAGFACMHKKPMVQIEMYTIVPELGTVMDSIKLGPVQRSYRESCSVLVSILIENF